MIPSAGSTEGGQLREGICIGSAEQRVGSFVWGVHTTNKNGGKPKPAEQQHNKLLFKGKPVG